MERRNFLKAGAATAGTMAGLLALTGKSEAQAKADLVTAAGGSPGTDLLILDPSSPQFRGLTQGFNRRWVAPNAVMVFVPLTEYGAAEALANVIGGGWAQNFRVRGGGHCYEDFVFNADTRAIVDVSLLNAIGYDQSQGCYFAQAGGTNWDLYRQLYWQFGKTLPAGSCYSVGLGGHICGGGYGLMSRAFGLTVEHLRDAVAGPSRRAARKARPDRAARGVAKYADPKTGDTWSGLGRAPRWIASARNRDAFLIDKGGKAAEAPAAKKRRAPKASSIKKVAAAKKAARKKAPRAGAAKSTASSGA